MQDKAGEAPNNPHAINGVHLTLNPSNAESTFVQSTRMQNLWKASKPCHVGIHWIALHEYSQMSTYMPGFQSFFRFLHHFVLAKLANSSIRVKELSFHAWNPAHLPGRCHTYTRQSIERILMNIAFYHSEYNNGHVTNLDAGNGWQYKCK